MSTVIIVTREIGSKAQRQIIPNSNSVLEGVELLLNNNLFSETVKTAGAQQVDCSALLEKGLKILQDDPFGLLSINLASNTVDVSDSFNYFIYFILIFSSSFSHFFYIFLGEKSI